MTQKKLFKDWFDDEAVAILATQITAVYPKFRKKQFIKQASQKLDSLEMMDRVKQFSNAMRLSLPQDINKALVILYKSLPPVMPNTESITNGFVQWPIGQFILDYAASDPQNYSTAMKAMQELTQRFSSEFAVRPFIENFPKQTMKEMLTYSKHKNVHIRRWSSEGCRPRLPWGKKLNALVLNPSPIFLILENLKNDPELYVRKSVANNLNDIAKDHPKKVVALCKKWLAEKSEGREHRQWITKRALRTLIKNGDPTALELFGYTSAKAIQTKLIIKPKSIRIGDQLTLKAVFNNTSDQMVKILLDYAVDYVRKNNKRGVKVFKWKEFELAGGQSISFEKKQKMYRTTTRALYPGMHTISLQLNGKRQKIISFQLEE